MCGRDRPGSSAITLVLPGQSRGDARRLAGRSGPLGEVVSDCGTDDRPEQLVAFDPVKVLAWMTARGLVRAVAEIRRKVSGEG